MTKDYQKRSSKEYNMFRGLFQWITCNLVYGLYYKIAFGLTIEGRENVPRNGFCIAASNHVSAIDPFLIACAVNRRVAFMAKIELFEKKIMRLFLDLLGAFAVNREKLSPSTIKTAHAIKHTNWLLGIFPQGTRERDDNMDNINKGFAKHFGNHNAYRTLSCPGHSNKSNIGLKHSSSSSPSHKGDLLHIHYIWVSVQSRYLFQTVLFYDKDHSARTPQQALPLSFQPCGDP